MANTPAQEEFLAITRKSQEAVIAAIKTWVEAVKTTRAKIEPLTDKLPKAPSFGVPFADRLPGREETVAGAYRLAEQVLVNQRRFAEDLLKMMTPLMPGNVESTPASSPTKSAPVTSAPVNRAPADVPAGPAAKSESARPAAKSTAARPAAKSTAARPAPKGTTAKSTAAKRTTAKSTTAKSTPKGTAARPAPKDTSAS